MKYLVALGNPGSEYRETRHNIGWLVADQVLNELNFPGLVFSAKYQAKISQGEIDAKTVMVLYPDTFMNHSGVVVRQLKPISQTDDLVVIHDDIDLALGEIKLSVGRGDGGHNGVRSIIEQLGTKDFVRIRLGISPKSIFTGKIKRPRADKLPKYVLGKFTTKELNVINQLGKTLVEIIETVVRQGSSMAMNRYN